MIQVQEAEIDRITELFYRIAKGEIPQALDLPPDYPQNEVRQVVEYANRFLADYTALCGSMGEMSRGNLDVTVPPGKMQVLQSFKNLHANLRHLTWKTQQIASGDLSQQVDFMGDFSKAFNSMTRQLHDAFERIDRQNQELSHANQRMKRDLDAAARIQRTLLPQSFPQVAGVRFAWSYRPCDELGGDALNIVRINDDLLALYVLDVSGHGVPAALLSVTVSRNLHPRAGGEVSLVATAGAKPDGVAPAAVAAQLNSLYPMESNGNHYFTMIYALLDVRARRLRYTVAGHPGPVLVRAGRVAQRFEVASSPIGFFDDSTYEEAVIDLKPGDRLYFHSDGLTEEFNAASEEFGDERLMAAMAESHAMDLDEALGAIVQRVKAWRGEEHLKDDVSILAIEVP